MISLREIDMSNFTAVSDLKVNDEQKEFVGSADWIIALAYADRSRNAHVLAIMLNETPIGVVMTSEYAMKDESGFYYIPQIFIDIAYQQCGYGRQAMMLIIGVLSAERLYDSIRLDVDQADIAAINLYRSLGFIETGYSDLAHPDLLFFGLKSSTANNLKLFPLFRWQLQVIYCKEIAP